MPDGKDYIAKTYQALKDNLEGFNKTEQEYRQLISTDGEYRKRVYSALRDNLEGFNRTEDDFYVQLGVKKKSGGGGSQSGATGTSVDPAAQQPKPKPATADVIGLPLRKEQPFYENKPASQQPAAIGVPKQFTKEAFTQQPAANDNLFALYETAAYNQRKVINSTPSKTVPSDFIKVNTGKPVAEQVKNPKKEEYNTYEQQKQQALAEMTPFIDKTINSLLENGEYKNFFTTGNVFDEGKARDYFDKFVTERGGGKATRELLLSKFRSEAKNKLQQDDPAYQKILEEKMKASGVDFGKYSQAYFTKLTEPYVKNADAITAEAKTRAEQYMNKLKPVANAATEAFNQYVASVNEQLKNGQINEQQAKELYGQKLDEYNKQITSINKQYAAMVQKIQSSVNSKYASLEKTINQLRSSIDNADVFNSLPKEEQAKIKKAYTEANTAYHTLQNNIRKVNDEYGNPTVPGLSNIINKGLQSGWYRGLSGIGNYLQKQGHDGDFTKWLMSKETDANVVAPAQYEWSKDEWYKRVAGSTSTSIGASAPILLPTIAAGYATGGTSVPSMVTGAIGTGLVSYAGEKAQNTGEVYKQVMEQTGDESKAIAAANEFERKQAKSMPFYFVGGLGSVALLRSRGVVQKLVGGALEQVEEIPTEYWQSYTEAQATQGYKKDFISFVKENPEIAADTFFSTLGQSGAFAATGSMINALVAKSPYGDKQLFADMIQKEGAEFAINVLENYKRTGVIDETAFNNGVMEVQKVDKMLRSFDQMGVSGDKAKAMLALNYQAEALKKKIEQEKTPAVKILYEQRLKAVNDKIKNVETNAPYAVFTLPGGNNSTMTLFAEDIVQMEKDGTLDAFIQSTDGITSNDPKLNAVLQNIKQRVGNPKEAEEGAYVNNENIEESRNSNNVANTQQPQQDGVENKQQANNTPSGINTPQNEQTIPEQVQNEQQAKTFKLDNQEKFYHASNRKRVGRLSANEAQQFGVGVYFSTSQELVKGEFGKNVTEVKLNIQNPVYTGTKQWQDVQQRAIELADQDYGKRNALTLDEEDGQEYFKYDKEDFDNYYEIDSRFISDAAKELGYDAIIDKGQSTYENEIVVLDESKIIYPEDEQSPPTTPQPVQPIKPAAQEQGTETAVPESADAVGQGDAAAAPSVSPADDYDVFLNEMMDYATGVKDSSFEYRLDIPGMAQKERDGAVKDIRAGKQTKRRTQFEAAVRAMFDKRSVSVNRGKGTQSEFTEIPFEEFFGTTVVPYDNFEIWKAPEVSGWFDDDIDNINEEDEQRNFEQNAGRDSYRSEVEREVRSTNSTEAAGIVNTPPQADAEQVPQPAVGEQDAGIVPPQPPTEDATDTEENDDLDYLANNIKSIGEVSKYLSGETIEKYTEEAPTNDQTIQSQDLLSALESGVAIIDKAKEMWGDKYVENMLDYIEKSTAGVSNKALMYVSLENAVNADLASFPERETELRKLLEQVYTESQAYLREASLAINYGRLRRFARTGYNLSQITDNFFAPEERAARVTIAEAVQAPIADVQKMYEEQLQANEDLKKRNEELEKKVAKQYGDTRIRERKIKLADKLDKIADRIGNFGRVSSDITKNSLAPDIQKYVADAIRYVAAEIRTGKEIPKAIVDAAKKFANDKLTPDFLKKQIEDGLKEAGFTTKEITKTTDELKEDKQRRDAILEFKDKNGRTPKEIITDALIQKGFSKTTTIKGEKRQILDWRKLAGRAGTEEEIKRNVEEVVKSIEGLKDEVEFAQDLFVQEIIDLRESVINKSLTELKRKNRDAVTTEQRSAARRLAELYSFGLFDKAEDEFDNALNKAAGINLTQENYSAAKDIARGLERIYVTSFKGGNLNDISAKFAIENLNNQLRLLLIDETKKQGSSALRIANMVRSYFDVQQTMVLMNLKQTVENPLSGLQANALEAIEDVFSKSSTKEQRSQRLAQMKNVAADMITQGGLGYGDVENLFVNRKHIDDTLNAVAGKSKLAHTLMSGISGRITLNTMDAMFKFSITEKKFTHNLIKILTDKTNPNRMEKEDAVKFVSEQLTGQTFEEAKKTAQETIKFINKDAGKELIPDNPISVERFANDIVKGALMMGGKLTAEQIKAAYNAAYRSAGLNIGHVSNNFLSKMIVGGSAQIESKISLAIKRKQWGRAAAYTYYSIFFRNILNPFVGGGTNWIVIRFEKLGGGLLTGLAYNKAAKDYQLDLTNANDAKSIEESLYKQARAKDSFMRGLIGGTISWTLFAALKAVADDDDEKEMKKWRTKNKWATRYTDIVIPEPILANMQWNNKEASRYVGGWFSKNDAFDPVSKLMRASQYATKGQSGKTWGALGEVAGMNLNTPLPWRIVKDGVVIYQGATGKDPYHGDYKPSSGFLNGVFQGGFIEFLGYRPERQKSK